MNFEFGEVWQYILADKSKGAEVLVICETREDGRIYYYKPRLNRVDSKLKQDFLDDYIYKRSS